jgi:hypothetical protein
VRTTNAAPHIAAAAPDAETAMRATKQERPEQKNGPSNRIEEGYEAQRQELRLLFVADELRGKVEIARTFEAFYGLHVLVVGLPSKDSVDGCDPKQLGKYQTADKDHDEFEKAGARATKRTGWFLIPILILYCLPAVVV